MILSSNLFNYLLAFFLLSPLFVKGQEGCKAIRASIQVQDNEGKGVIEINYDGQTKNLFKAYLVGPNQYFNDKIDRQVTGLSKGSYVLVLVGMKENDNFCIKHFDITIK